MTSEKHYIARIPPVYYLDANEAFRSLTDKEKEYTFHCHQTAWIGGLIDLLQSSPESAGLFLFINRFFQAESPNTLADKAKLKGFTTEEVDNIIAYFASVLGNLGNYLSFGDTKFIPAVSKRRLAEFLALSDSFEHLESLWKEIETSIYSLHPRRCRLDFGPKGVSTYYSGDIVKKDIEWIQKYLESVHTEAYNTRVFKELRPNADGKAVYTLLFASADKRMVEPKSIPDIPPDAVLNLKYGDYSELMNLMVQSIQEVEAAALNPTQAKMWHHYANSFTNGSIDEHKEGSRLWVTDKNPAVETYIGFIESYRDPFGVRGEFESFVAVVNKSMSAKFQRLVDNAVELIAQLPWPSTYEKDTFLRPDFTSLDVVTFACTGIPVGINIPNYDDIRQVDGFKNVSLGNVLSSRFKDPQSEFIREEDRSLYIANVARSFEIQVGLHELLGHGSGKLFKRNADGTFNFDPSTTKDLTTNGPITSWYEAGETWDSKFSNLSSSMEECRAECVGVYLCNLPTILKLFGENPDFKPQDSVPDVVYVNWLSMVRSGVLSMEFYSPSDNAGDIGAWTQAHCCARYVILRVLLEASDSLVRIQTIQGTDGQPDLLIHLDRHQLLSVARPAIGNFLAKLQYYKSTANAKDGSKFFTHYSQLTPEHMKLRQVVLDRKRPRPIYIQPNLVKTSRGIELVSYDPTPSAMIQSFVDRYTQLPLGPKALDALDQLWQHDFPYFKDVPL